MKILAISDLVDPWLHNPTVNTNLADVTLILGCGDLPPYYLDFLVSALNVPLFYVAGNHDRPRKPSWPLPAQAGGKLLATFGGTNLDEQVVHHRGLLIGGLEGSMRYNRDPGPQYTEGEMSRKILRMFPQLLWNRLRYGRYLDVLITHAPPRGIHDGKDLCHTGFNAFLRFMDRFKPRYLLHGHVHTGGHSQRPETRYGQTHVINVCPYHLLDIQPL
jgi:Icc-related predicted phosphoesterase